MLNWSRSGKANGLKYMGFSSDPWENDSAIHDGFDEDETTKGAPSEDEGIE